ncbi:MAG: DUF4154 domain-containing protein [Bacteroidales bacterium]|nr:DUF4154 domain-containing protein [Bacteroidales bacterium]
MRKRWTIFFLLICITFLLCKNIFAQEITDDKVKAGFIYKFLEYTKWENEEEIKTFKVGVYSNDKTLNSTLQSLENLTIKDKKIEVVYFSNIAQIEPCQIIMVSYTNRDKVAAIFDKTKNTQTLLVSDRCDQKRFFMINFIHTENGKIEFEINPKNMADENLYASPKLLLIGGKEIDVRKLYLETEKSLQDEKERSEGFEQELETKKQELQELKTQLILFRQEILKQNETIDAQNQNITNQKKILNKVLKQIVEQDAILNAKTSQNKNLITEINKNELELNKKDSSLIEMQKTMYEYTILQAELKEKINKQLEKIRTQRLILILVIAILILTLTLGFLLYRNNQIKKEANIKLEKLSIVASETDNAVMIMDASGKFEWLNEGFTRMYGYTLTEFIKTKGDNILIASNNQDIQSIFDKCIKTKKSITYETSNTSRNNTKLFVQTTLTPILDKSDNITKLVAIDANITDIKYAEEKIIQKNIEIQKQADELAIQTTQLSKANIILEEQKEKLQETLLQLKSAQTQLVESEKMASLGILTAGIAHEINNPINFINAGIDGLNITIKDLMLILKKYDEIDKNNIDIIITEIAKLKTQIDYEEVIKGLEVLLNNIKVGAIRATSIVKSLKTFTWLDDGELRFSDIHENIDSALILLRNLCKDKVEIIKEYGNLPKIECFPGRINQMFMNIILNSLQAIDEKGTITIKTRLDKEKEKRIAIEIKDTGHGIPEEIIQHIFDPFFTTKEMGKGTGLGLSITQSIIEKHKGNIEVLSEVGKGTKFIVYLPLHNEEFVLNNG